MCGGLLVPELGELVEGLDPGVGVVTAEVDTVDVEDLRVGADLLVQTQGGFLAHPLPRDGLDVLVPGVQTEKRLHPPAGLGLGAAGVGAADDKGGLLGGLVIGHDGLDRQAGREVHVGDGVEESDVLLGLVDEIEADDVTHGLVHLVGGLSNDAKVGTGTTNTPEEFRVLGLGGLDNVAIGSDHADGLESIDD